MRQIEKSILDISEDTERACDLSRYLDQSTTEVSSEFVSALLADRYDVIRAEGVEIIVNCRMAVSSGQVQRLVEDRSELVRSRALVLAATLGYQMVVDSVLPRIGSSYERIHLLAAQYILNSSSDIFYELIRMIEEGDPILAPNAIDLLMLSAKGDHRTELREFLIGHRSSSPPVLESITSAIELFDTEE